MIERHTHVPFLHTVHMPTYTLMTARRIDLGYVVAL